MNANRRNNAGEENTLTDVLINIVLAVFVVAIALGLVLLAIEQMPPAPDERTSHIRLMEER